MSLQTALRTCIEVPVSPRQFGDTRLYQKARFTTLTHKQNELGECNALIEVEVTMYAAEGDDCGAELTAEGFRRRLVTLSADNNTVVDAATGEILAIRYLTPDTTSEADWLAKQQSYEQVVMLQGDFFELLRHYSPIDIEDLIRQHITQADQMGRFA